jgi:hypothetical protein
MRQMKDSGIEWIGDIPEGWEVAPLKRYCNIFVGGHPILKNANIGMAIFHGYNLGNYKIVMLANVIDILQN